MNSDIKELFQIIGVILGIVTVMILSVRGVQGFQEGDAQSIIKAERQKAVETGAGKYQFDPDTGKVKFVYVNLQEYTNYIVNALQPVHTKVPIQ